MKVGQSISKICSLSELNGRNRNPGALTESARLAALADLAILDTDAVAQDRMRSFVAGKEATDLDPDPVEELRKGWDRYVAFGLANPDVFAILNEIGSPLAQSPATLSGMAALERRVADVARAGRLRVPEARAVALFHASAVGVVKTQLAVPSQDRDCQVLDLAREAALAAILDAQSPVPEHGVATMAISLRARLDEATTLSSAESRLLDEWLGRLVDSATGNPADPLEPSHRRTT